MKNILLIMFLIMFLASGCRSTKKATESRVIAATTTEVKETTAAQLLISIDTTTLSDTETTYIKTEYYQPVDVTDMIGPVKSVEEITISTRTEAKGKTEAIKAEATAKNSLISEITDTKTEETTKQAPAPRRWILFVWILLVLAIIISLRNSPVVKSVLSVARKFLKI